MARPVRLTLDPKVPPCHVSIHIVPVSKLEKTKSKLDDMLKCGELKKVNQPTKWCNNMTVRKRVLPNGTTKVFLCLDPSQKLNKAIIIPFPQYISRRYFSDCQGISTRLSRNRYFRWPRPSCAKGLIQPVHHHAHPVGSIFICWLRLPYGNICLVDLR